MYWVREGGEDSWLPSYAAVTLMDANEGRERIKGEVVGQRIASRSVQV